jgi:hypothetical protein
VLLPQQFKLFLCFEQANLRLPHLFSDDVGISCQLIQLGSLRVVTCQIIEFVPQTQQLSSELLILLFDELLLLTQIVVFESEISGVHPL